MQFVAYPRFSLASYYAHQRREILPFLPTSFARLLDVGCGEAAFGALVRQQYPQAEVWGVEPVPAVAALAATRLHQVRCGLFGADLGLPEGHFDVITFNDSLEHMTDEVQALRLAHRLLAPGGMLLCSVPNVRYLENVRHLLLDADWRYADSGILDRTHLRFFTKKSIRRTVQDNGFDVERLEGINSHWWSGPRVSLLRLVFGRRIEDMRWQQFVVIARRSDQAA